jgi:hypothetical protein
MRRLRQLEEENRRLKSMVAEPALTFKSSPEMRHHFFRKQLH